MNAIWTDGVIPYQFEIGLPAAQQEAIELALNEWMSDTDGAIAFVPRSGPRSVLFKNEGGCVGNGRGNVTYYSAQCALNGHLRHELGHLIGFDHHHQRSDRDHFLELMDATLFPCANDNVYVQLLPNSPWPAMDVGPGGTFGRYDYESVMHYVYGQARLPENGGGPCPFNCLLPTPDGNGGDAWRAFIKRDASTAGMPLCPNDPNTLCCPGDIADAYNVITPHDSAAAVEAYSTQKLWSPGESMSKDIGSHARLVFELAPGVFATGNPGLAARSSTERVAVTRGDDGNVYLTTAVAGPSPQGPSWTNLGKPTGSVGDPAVVSWSPARIDVVVIAESGGVKRVYKRAFDLGGWEPDWVLLPGTQPSDLTGGVAIASWGINRLDIFANAGSMIRHQAWTGSSWTAWESPGGAVPGGTAGTPAAVSWDANRIDVVVKAADDQIWQLTWDNGWAPTWTAISWVGNMNSAPTITSWGPGRLDMFIRSISGHLWQQTCAGSACKSASSWPGWSPLGGFLSSGPAAASLRGQRRIDVVSLSDDGQALVTPTNQRGMWHRYWPWPYADRHPFDEGDDHGNSEAGTWTGDEALFEADCSSAYKTMMVGLSSRAAGGSRRAHSILCGSDAQVRWDTQNVIDLRGDSRRSDGMGHTIPFGSAPDWDVGFYKGQCAGDEVVTGVAQETGGRLAAVRCSKMPSGKALGGACTTRIFTHEHNRGSETPQDWAPGFYKGQCAAGEGVAGVSAYTTAAGEGIIAGAAHAIRCCRIVKRTRGDWDGDGRADFSMVRLSDRTIHIKPFAGTNEIVKQPLESDSYPETLDMDGDGLMDTVYRRTTDYTWFFQRTTGGAVDSIQWGTSGDMVAVGDYDGDRRDDFAVVRPSSPNFVWFIRPGDTSLPALPAVSYGETGDVPVPGDYDGDGRDDIAFWRPSTGNWHVIPTSTGVGQVWQQWGTSGDKALPGDYDGDGKTDPAVFRPSSGTGTWFVKQSSDGAQTSLVWSPSIGVAHRPRDYDGDGRTDLAYHDPNDQTWHVMPSSGGPEIVVTFGQSGDVPF